MNGIIEGACSIADTHEPVFRVWCRGYECMIIGRDNAESYSRYLSKTFERVGYVYVEFAGYACSNPLSPARAIEKYYKS